LKEYSNQQTIVNFLKGKKDNKFILPNDFFYDINHHIFSKFLLLREKVSDIRNNLAHINIDKDYNEIYKIKDYIKSFEELIESKILENLDLTESNKKYTLTYLIDDFRKNIQDKFENNSKLETIKYKYDLGEVDELRCNNRFKFKNFIEKNIELINKLILYKEDKKYFFTNDEINDLVIKSKPIKKLNKAGRKKVNTDKNGIKREC
jgi:hypothetical protein